MHSTLGSVVPLARFSYELEAPQFRQSPHRQGLIRFSRWSRSPPSYQTCCPLHSPDCSHTSSRLGSVDSATACTSILQDAPNIFNTNQHPRASYRNGGSTLGQNFNQDSGSARTPDFPQELAVKFTFLALGIFYCLFYRCFGHLVKVNDLASP